MQTITINTSQNIAIDYEIGGLGERIVARLIDYGIFILVYIAGIILLAVMGSSAALGGVVLVVVVVAYASLFVFYDLICETFMNGQSIGKRLMKIKVVSLDGGQPTVGQYLLRWLFRIVDFGIGGGVLALITAAVSEKSQRVGDLVAGTALIRTAPRTKIDNVAFMPFTEPDYEPVYTEVVQLNDKDVALIHEVINNYMQTGNTVAVYNMANRIKEHLGLTVPAEMNSLQLLQTILKDYNYINSQEQQV